MRIVGQLVINNNSAVREANQSRIGFRILTSNLRMHLNPRFQLIRALHTLKLNINIYLFKIELLEKRKDLKMLRCSLVVSMIFLTFVGKLNLNT